MSIWFEWTKINPESAVQVQYSIVGTNLAILNGDNLDPHHRYPKPDKSTVKTIIELQISLSVVSFLFFVLLERTARFSMCGCGNLFRIRVARGNVSSSARDDIVFVQNDHSERLRGQV